MSRQALRRERYALARQLGFSSRQARIFRDRSVEKLQIETANRKVALERKPDKTDQDLLDIQQIENFQRRRQTEPQFAGRGISQDRRLEMFKIWSRPDVGFPAGFQNLIFEFNRAAGFPPHHSYGYRLFYFLYVEQLDSEMAELQADYTRD